MTLTAVPSEGCSFEKWSGDIGDNEASNISISVVMDTDRTIIADFTGCTGPLEITVNASIYSSGPTTTINASFGSLTCSAIYTAQGTRVNVTATAAAGYRFDAWRGAVNGSQETISFISGSSEPLTARFSEISPSPWPWVIIGIAAVIVVGLFIYRLKSGRAKIPKETQSNAAGPPQPQGE